jgi:hypothetical protein
MADMDERQLVKILREEESDAASYYDSELAQAQADAMDRFHAKAYGDEVDGRSKVVTHDIEDTINWIMPHLMRVFLESDDVISCADDAIDDGDDTLRIAADYLSHVVFRDNEGETLIHDFAFDGLLQKVAVARAYWMDPEPKPVQILEGVPPEQLQRYMADPEYEILESEAEQKLIEGQPYECFNLKVRRTPRVGRVKLETIPPENFRVSRRAVSLKEADYHGWKSEAFLAEIIREFPEKRYELDPSGEYRSAADDGDAELASDTRAEARFPLEPTTALGGDPGGWNELGRKKVWQSVEYIRCDYDGDGTVELRRVRRVGNVILENDEVEETEFVAWSPIRVAHRLIGRSLADTLIDLQKIRTVLTRAALDGMSRSLLPRTVVNKRMATDGTIEQILDHDIGAVIEVEGPVGEAFREVVTPDVSQGALAAIEYFDRRSEEASGVTRHAQGIAPDAITQTKGGIEMLQAAANSRVEMVARWMGIGLQELFGKALRLLIAHQDAPRVVKLSGKRMEVDPRRWNDEMTVLVHVGMAAESRERRLVNLNLIAQKQEQILLQAGPSNPMVGLPEYRQTLVQMAEAMGFKNGSRFFKEVPDGWQPPPQEDPKVAEVKSKAELAQAELQQKGQLAQAEMQQKGQLQAAEMQGKQQLAQMEAQFQSEMQAQKAELERQIAEIKMQSEAANNAERIALERELALIRMQQERELAMLRMQQDREIALEGIKAKAKSAESGTNGAGFKSGGRLDA